MSSRKIARDTASGLCLTREDRSGCVPDRKSNNGKMEKSDCSRFFLPGQKVQHGDTATASRCQVLKCCFNTLFQVRRREEGKDEQGRKATQEEELRGGSGKQETPQVVTSGTQRWGFRGLHKREAHHHLTQLSSDTDTMLSGQHPSKSNLLVTSVSFGHFPGIPIEINYEKVLVLSIPHPQKINAKALLEIIYV